MKNKIKTIIVDDNSIFLEGISSCIMDDDRFEVIAKFSSGMQLLNSKELVNADLLLMDIEMPELNGIETAKRVNFSYPNLKMIAITLYQDKVYLQQIIEAGFKGFVNKVKIPDQLFETIESVLKGKLNYPLNVKIQQS
jgi:DNA-binding NarL/FixJ family response regulator